jgi:hypothetical protein
VQADADHSNAARQRLPQSALSHPLLLNACLAILYFGAAKLGFVLASATKQV